MVLTNKYNYKIIILFGLFLLFGTNVYAISSGANEPIADNELGLTAKDCAKQYCEDKDGMGLWMSLVNECVESPNPYFMEKIHNLNKINFNYGTSPIVAGSVCAMIGVIGLIFGYIIGSYEKTVDYIKLEQDDNEYGYQM